MMRVGRVNINSNAYKQTQFHAGEHLAYYYVPIDSKNRPHVQTEVENGIFTRYLENYNGQRDLLTASSTKERMFMEGRQEHADREELMQRLNYTNGMHYSAAQNISI
ncbi:MAG: hypothetical protein ACI33P_11540 [Lysinibacillus sp.]